ncbi:unnamed protein product [Urochloa decumbens]|uniref:FAF domain-containing protein n=1 Tax=Urochloa decumbens TaxID=240449 RepID=A0ABC9APW5_9POAL
MQQRAAAGGSAWWRGAVGACTESLGSETGDAVGYADAEIIDWLRAPAAADDEEEEGEEALAEEQHRVRAPSPAPEKEEEEEKGRRPRRGLCLPPVMPRASEALVMRAERSGGRLILTEVRAAERQLRGVVFRASRDGGRLQLCFAAAAAGAGGVRAATEPDAGAGELEEEARKQQEASGGGGENMAGSGGEVAAAAPHGGEFCQVAAAGRGRVEVSAVVGI